MRWAVLFVLAAAVAQAQQNQLAPTPPMGWNSWNSFGCKITEADVRAQAEAMVSSGMRDAGFEYIVIDDCWQGGRGADGRLMPNEKFHDMKALADFIHSKGLKFGIYSSPGPKTCAKYTGSYQHEELDAAIFAAWGVDYLKYDWCSAKDVYQPEQQAEIFARMGHALRQTGRPIVYSLSNYGMHDIWKWAPSTGAQLWRTTDDIAPYVESIYAIGFGQAGMERYAGPGHWNDPDMLEIGNRDLSLDENRLHMSLWAMLAAPLMAGNNLATMSDATRGVLTNREVIAIDQDSLGRQGSRVFTEGPVEVWSRPLANGDLAVALFDKGDSAESIHLTLRELGSSDRVRIRDLWQQKDLGIAEGTLTTTAPAHGVVLLRLHPEPPATFAAQQ